VSSILDALRKLEDADRPPTRDGHAPPRAPSRLPLIAGIAVAFVAGVGIALWFGGHRTAVSVRPAETAAGTPAPKPATPATNVAVSETHATMPPPAAEAKPDTAAPPRTAPVSPVTAAAPPTIAPVAPVVAAAPATIPAPAPTRPPLDTEPPRARLLDVPRPVTARAPEPPVAVEPPPEPVAVERAAPETTPAPPVEHLVPMRLPEGAPPVQVNFLAYSRVAERRTVTLTVGSTGMVTLREGESAGDVQVERILPDRVQLRHGDHVFAVKAIE
jgi:hypothetical protein